MMLASSLVWLADFHLTALGLLAAAIGIGSMIGQPAKRLAIARATTLGLSLLLGLSMIPGWSLWSLAGPGADAAVAAAEVASPAITPIAPHGPVPQATPALPAVDFMAAPEVEETAAALPAAEIKSVDLAHEAAKLVLPLYLSGALLATAWLLVGWWQARRLVGQAVEADHATQQAIESLTDTPPQLLVSDRLAGPVAIGLVRPTILLPQRLIERSDAAELRAVLAHELAHVHGGDLWLLAGLRWLLVILWCNPLYWLLRRRVRLDQETLADAAAVDQSDRHAYAERLVGWARELTPQPHLAGSAGLWESPSQLRKRIAVLLDDGFTVLRRSSLRWRVACGVACLTLAAAASLVTFGPAEASEQRDARDGATDKSPAVRAEEEPSATSWNPNQVLEFQAVHAETGEAIPGVSLELQNVGPGIEFQDVSTYATNSQGLAEIKLPAKPPTAVRVYPSKTGFVPLRVYWAREPHPTMPKSVTVPMLPGQPIGGRLQNEAGEPIAGAMISIHYWGPGAGDNPHIRANFNDESTKASTDAEGRWRFDSMPGNLNAEALRIYVSHPDYLSDHLQRGYLPTPVIKQPALRRLYDQTAVMTMQSGVTIEGLVVDGDGQPIPNARIYDRKRMGGGSEDTRTTTDERGQFRLTGVPAIAFDGTSEYRHLPRRNRPDSLTLTVHATGYAAELVEVDQADKPLEIELSPGKTVEGQVLDSQGKPVESVFVRPRLWRQYRERLYLDAKTDKDGRFRLEDVPNDKVEYDFSKEGYLSTEGFSMKPPSDAYRIVLREPVRIRGAVTDAETGEIIHDFSLTLGTDYEDGRAPFWQVWQRRELTTGLYETELTQAGFSYRLRIDAKGYLPAESRVFRPYDPDQGELTHDFKLRRADRLTGAVLDLDGKPLANAKVYRARGRLNVTERKVSYAEQFDQPPVVTDQQGQFSFPPEVEPFCLVVAHQQGIGMVTEKEFEESGEIRIAPWNANNQQLQIIRRAAEGQLVDFPNPSPTSRLRETGATPQPPRELTGDSIKIVPMTIPGNDSPTDDEREKHAKLVPADSLPIGAIGMAPGNPNTIAGKCVDGMGEPLTDVEVLLFHKQMHSGLSKQLQTAKVDVAGKFRFANVIRDPESVDDSPMAPTNDLYVIVARRDGYASQSFAHAPFQITRDGVRVSFIWRPAGTLTGRITDSDGQPVANARVRAAIAGSFDLGNQVLHAALTDANGRYVIKDLPTGDFAAQRVQREQARLARRDEGFGTGDLVAFPEDVTVTHAGYAVRKQPLDRVPGELNMSLAPAAIIAGRIIHDTGKSVEGLGVQIQTDPLSSQPGAVAPIMQTTAVDSTGRYRFSSLPAGDYYLRVNGLYNTDFVSISGQKVEAVVGEPTTASDLVVSDGRVVRFQLLNGETGEPLKFDTQPSGVAWHFLEGDTRYGGSLTRETKVSQGGQFEYRIDNRAVRMGLDLPLPTDNSRGAYRQFRVKVPAGEVEQPFPFPIDLRKATSTQSTTGSVIQRAHQLTQADKLDDAIDLLTKAVQERPADAKLLMKRGDLNVAAKRYAGAIADYEAAMEQKPRFLFLLQNNLAYLLATAEDPDVRDPERAVELARQAIAGAPQPMAQLGDTLATAYAAASDFEAAIEALEKALTIATDGEKPALQDRLKKLRANKGDGGLF